MLRHHVMNILNGLYLSKNGFHWTISLAPALCLETTQENVKICSLSTSLEGEKGASVIML